MVQFVQIAKCCWPDSTNGIRLIDFSPNCYYSKMIAELINSFPLLNLFPRVVQFWPFKPFISLQGYVNPFLYIYESSFVKNKQFKQDFQS